jgi:hypothetical protein
MILAGWKEKDAGSCGNARAGKRCRRLLGGTLGDTWQVTWKITAYIKAPLWMKPFKDIPQLCIIFLFPLIVKAYLAVTHILPAFFVMEVAGGVVHRQIAP